MIKSPVLSVSLLATGDRLSFEQHEDRLTIKDLPPKAFVDPYDTVIALELEGEPEAYPAFY